MTPPARPPSPPSPPSSRPPGGGERSCAAARRALLSADPDELRGRSGTPLWRHLEGCDPCRELASRLGEAVADLDAWLSAPGKPPDVEGILAAALGRVQRGAAHERDERAARAAGSRAPGRAGHAATGSGAEHPAFGADGGPAPVHGGGRGTPGWRRTLRWALPTAVAAGVVGLLVLGNDPDRPGPDADASISGPRVTLFDEPPDLDLEVPPDTDAAVLATGDPDITVIWFLGGDR